MNQPEAQRSDTLNGPATSAKIKTLGRIHFGRLLRLEQATQLKSSTSFRFSVGVPSSGLVSAIDNLMPQVLPGQLPVDRLEWSLKDTSEELYVTDDGLTTSYGIFGSPRSGKTYLLIYLLRQLFSLSADRSDRRFGGLILDPKAELIDEVRAAMTAAKRIDDLVVLNTDELMRLDNSVNIIDAGLDPAELGRVLVLAAQSAGIGASEPFWFGAWSNLFSAAMQVLDWIGEEVTTLRSLLDSVLRIEGHDENGRPERRIQRLARQASQRSERLSEERGTDLQLAVEQIEGFYRQDGDNIATVETLIAQAYSGFRQSRWSRYSQRELKIPGGTRSRFYDEIINDGKVVLVSVSSQDPGMAKVLCTLVKILFQQTVLSRSARVRARTLTNFVRPVLLACDEYSQVASEVPGQPMGDGHFFSLARQNGCMGLIATQSVNVLQASSLKENWRSVFSNFGAKIFMRLSDNETADEASKLAGEADWYVTSLGASQQKDGMTSSRQRELRERKSLPTSVLTQVLVTGQGVFVGSVDGGHSQPGTFFLSVPRHGLKD